MKVAIINISFELEQLKKVIKFGFFIFIGHRVNCVMVAVYMASGSKATWSGGLSDKCAVAVCPLQYWHKELYRHYCEIA